MPCNVAVGYQRSGWHCLHLEGEDGGSKALQNCNTACHHCTKDLNFKWIYFTLTKSIIS